MECLFHFLMIKSTIEPTIESLLILLAVSALKKKSRFEN
ncbi:hypothetical protein SBA7_30040 [Candidatus Sulfotelmatobacter sp. SbA7]|nr:hypothetical protein SBA7_30040 [Candidatus Sulfotelmatobacter sp. SbA7]